MLYEVITGSSFLTEDEVALDAWLEASRAWAERQLERHFVPATEPAPDAGTEPGLRGPDGARRLAEAMRYAVLGGGKRLRPAVVRLACSWLSYNFV